VAIVKASAPRPELFLRVVPIDQVLAAAVHCEWRQSLDVKAKHIVGKEFLMVVAVPMQELFEGME
jgi:hypothetical protein